MGFLSTTVQATGARHALRRRPEEEVLKAVDEKAALLDEAVDLAHEDFDGDIPDDVHVAIFQDPEAYIGAGDENSDVWGQDEVLEKDYVGFDELVKKLMGEGKSEEAARKIAASIGRKKYGAKFSKPASTHR